MWLHGEVEKPPFSQSARIEAGLPRGRLQQRGWLGLPHSRPTPPIGTRCHELRLNDEDQTWRIVYRLDSDAILILDVFTKKTQATPRAVLTTCKHRLKRYDALMS